MAAVLSTLLSSVLGEAGFWIMVTGVFVGFFGTLLSDQDGFGRLFANGARILSKRLQSHARFGEVEFLRRVFVVAWVTVLPIALFFLLGEPVALLKVSGAIEAAHIPVVTGLILYLNRRSLPRVLQLRRVRDVRRQDDGGRGHGRGGCA